MATRTQTVVFTDLTGYTNTVSRSDREALRELIASHEQLVAPVIERFGGRIVKNLGDSYMALFDFLPLEEWDSKEANLDSWKRYQELSIRQSKLPAPTPYLMMVNRHHCPPDMDKIHELYDEDAYERVRSWLQSADEAARAVRAGRTPAAVHVGRLIVAALRTGGCGTAQRGRTAAPSRAGITRSAPAGETRSRSCTHNLMDIAELAKPV